MSILFDIHRREADPPVWSRKWPKRWGLDTIQEGLIGGYGLF